MVSDGGPAGGRVGVTPGPSVAVGPAGGVWVPVVPVLGVGLGLVELPPQERTT